MSLTLVLLAAGMGSRYGGPKQIDPVGPDGSTLIDYAVFDALRVGFTHVVLVVRSDGADEVRRAVGTRLESRVRVDYAIQDASLPEGFAPPPGRKKPWGTGHAMVSAAPFVDGPFAVLNADDFYGAASYRLLSGWLDSARPGNEHALVTFELRKTLSPAGPVNRGICDLDEEGYVREVREVLRIVPRGGDAEHPGPTGAPVSLPGTTPVSLNFWGFAPGILASFRRAFSGFLEESGKSPSAELFIPAVVQGLVDAGEARVRALPGGGPWAGLTHREDRDHLVAVLAERTRRGEYPERLWE